MISHISPLYLPCVSPEQVRKMIADIDLDGSGLS